MSGANADRILYNWWTKPSSHNWHYSISTSFSSYEDLDGELGLNTRHSSDVLDHYSEDIMPDFIKKTSTDMIAVYTVMNPTTMSVSCHAKAFGSTDYKDLKNPTYLENLLSTPNQCPNKNGGLKIINIGK